MINKGMTTNKYLTISFILYSLPPSRFICKKTVIMKYCKYNYIDFPGQCKQIFYVYIYELIFNIKSNILKMQII